MLIHTQTASHKLGKTSSTLSHNCCTDFLAVWYKLLPSAGLISCFSVSAAGRYITSGSASGDIKLWSLTQGVQLDLQQAAHPAGVSALAFLEPGVVSLMFLGVHFRLHVMMLTTHTKLCVPLDMLPMQSIPRIPAMGIAEILRWG